MTANRTALIKALQGAHRQSVRAKPLRKILHPVRYYWPKILARFGTIAHKQCKTFFGDKIGIYLPEPVSTHLYRYGFFEHELSFTLIELLNEGDVFIDVGTHIGYFTLLSSKLVGENGKVISFEPTPRTRNALISNIAGRKNISIAPFAAWDTKTQLEFNDFGWIQSAWNSLFSARLEATPSGDVILVDTVRLDDYFEENNIVPDFIKIDAESAESQVLSGLKNTLATVHPHISLEVGDFNIEGVPTSRELIDLICGYGYKVFEFRQWELCEHLPKESYEYDNLFFIHPDKKH